MIVQQEEAVNLLNEQRSNVISMIQRGKELAKESDQTPEFVNELVSNLETEWKDAYSKTVDNLNQLRGFFIFLNSIFSAFRSNMFLTWEHYYCFSETQRIWITYLEQKELILKLLKRAEQELHAVPVQFASSKQLEDELKVKITLKNELKGALDIGFLKLKELSGHLSNIAAPEQIIIMNEDVSK